MCRWLAYQGTPIHLETLLFEPEYSLIAQSLRARQAPTTTNGDGFGVGWFGEWQEPGLFREVLPAWNDANLRNLAHHIRAGLFFAHVRASTGTATSRSNCHPFSAQGWMFMHNGQIGQYERVRRALDNTLPDALYEHRGGTTDSEAIFLNMLANGLDEDPKAAVERSIGVVRSLMAEAGVDGPFRMTAAISNGRQLVAARYSTDPVPPTLYFAEGDDGLIVVSEPLDARDGAWTALPPSTLLVSAPDGRVSIQELAV